MLQETIISASSSRLIAAIEDRVRAAYAISLFIDFDGTLVPIAADPSAPRLEPEGAEVLSLLAAQHRITTTIISGRSAEDLYTRIRIDGLIYAGNHGLEIFGRNLRFVEPAASARRDELRRLSAEVELAVRSVPGTLVEFKGLTTSVHYRQAPPEARPIIEQAVFAVVAPHGASFRINPGRKVYEIVPRTGWHKGAAVRWVNGRLPQKGLLSIYLGDDSTDEDAFSVMTEAITIKVGGAPATCARYRLAGPPAVHEFLAWLSEAAAQWRGGEADGGHD